MYIPHRSFAVPAVFLRRGGGSLASSHWSISSLMCTRRRVPVLKVIEKETDCSLVEEETGLLGRQTIVMNIHWQEKSERTVYLTLEGRWRSLPTASWTRLLRLRRLIWTTSLLRKNCTCRKRLNSIQFIASSATPEIQKKSLKPKEKCVQIILIRHKV